MPEFGNRNLLAEFCTGVHNYLQVYKVLDAAGLPGRLSQSGVLEFAHNPPGHEDLQ